MPWKKHPPNILKAFLHHKQVVRLSRLDLLRDKIAHEMMMVSGEPNAMMRASLATKNNLDVAVLSWGGFA
jgi:hypothetical protein